jgi:hypothetical protein
MKNTLLLIYLLAILAGCATAGRQFDMNAADKIKIGLSTSDDVVALLGQPTSAYKNGNGIVIMNYDFVRTAFGSHEPQSFTVAVAPDGKVRETYKHPTNH